MWFQKARVGERAVVDSRIENLPKVGWVKVREDEPGEDKEDEDDGGEGDLVEGVRESVVESGCERTSHIGKDDAGVVECSAKKSMKIVGTRRGKKNEKLGDSLLKSVQGPGNMPHDSPMAAHRDRHDQRPPHLNYAITRLSYFLNPHSLLSKPRGARRAR